MVFVGISLLISVRVSLLIAVGVARLVLSRVVELPIHVVVIGVVVLIIPLTISIVTNAVKVGRGRAVFRSRHRGVIVPLAVRS